MPRRHRQTHHLAEWKSVLDCFQYFSLPGLWRFAFKLGALPIERPKDKLQRIAGVERQLVRQFHELLVSHAAFSLNNSGLALRSVASQWQRSGA
jgi:hypothetical protein